MAGSVNKVILVGNIGKDPEIRQTNDGKKVASFSLATSESWKDRMSGERRERTEWHRVVIFNDRLVDVTERFLKKGSKIYLEGALQTRKWTDNNGQERYTTEVVLQQFRGELTMLDGRQGGEMGAGGMEADDGYGGGASYGAASGGGYSGGGRAAGAGTPSRSASRPPVTDLDDEIPF